MSDPNEYTVGWITAVEAEYVAARAFLEEIHQGPAYVSQHDYNTYTLGKIGQHLVVMATAPYGEYGMTQATAVAMRMVASFPNIRIGLMVGIGGGAPSSKHDIRLGDVVVSVPGNGNGGVIQYDFGKTVQEQAFQATRFLNQPPPLVRTTVQHLKAVYQSDGHQLKEAIEDVLSRKPRLRVKYQRPSPDSDQLYHSAFIHSADSQVPCTGNCDSDPSWIVSRTPRGDDEDNPAIHYGLIASGNQLMKDALIRDRLIEKEDVLCFEMEAAGLMNDFPCLVIRGICDYADSHKSKEWQGYAAMVAAAYARDLLLSVAPTRVEAETKLGEAMGEMTEVINNIRQDTAEGKCLEVLDWIAPKDHAATHAKHLSTRQKGTGEWLLGSEHFQRWLDKPGHALLCTGMPGAGKTIMTSIVVDHLQEMFWERHDIGLAYIYCDFSRQNEQSVEHILGVILRQLVRRYSAYLGIPSAIDKFYRQHRHTGNSLSLDSLLQALRSVFGLFTRSYIIIDALDECKTARGCRLRFLQELFGFQMAMSVNLITTSRPLPDVIQTFRQTNNSIKLEIQASETDLQRYLEGQSDRLPSFVRRDPVLQSRVKDTIVNAAGGMFLLATFHLESLIEEPTKGDLEAALEKLPRDFFHKYEQTIERIQKQNDNALKLAEKVLCWVVFAKQPMKREELQHAVMIEPGNPNSSRSSRPSIQKIVSVCAGLVDYSSVTEEFSLVHYTVYEYFERQAAGEGWLRNMHAHITHVCIDYIQSFARNQQGHRKIPRSLARYVRYHWLDHARETEILCRNAISNLVYNNDGKRALGSFYPNGLSTNGHRDDIQGWTPFHFLAYWGLSETIKLLLSKVGAACINEKDRNGNTPLYFAVRNNYRNTVGLLLRSGAETNTANILEAAKGFHMGVLELLVSSRATFNTEHGGIFWGHAAKWKSERLCEIALDLGLDINSTDDHGNTPLLRTVLDFSTALSRTRPSFTFANGPKRATLLPEQWSEAVDFLLLHGADINCRDVKDGSLLLYTVQFVAEFDKPRKAEKRVEKLLQKGAMVNVRDCSEKTPLYYAVDGGKRLCQLLLEHGAELDPRKVEINRPFYRGDGFYSPLHLATSRGLTSIIELFLGRDGVDPNIQDMLGRTPLHIAVDNTGYDKRLPCLRVLLTRNDVLIDAKDIRGETPLLHAAKHGQQDSVEQLIQHGADVSVLEPFETFVSDEARRYTIRRCTVAHGFTFAPYLSHESFDIEVSQVNYPRRIEEA